MIKVTLRLVAIYLVVTSCQRRVEPTLGCQVVIQESTDRYTYQFDEGGRLTSIHTTGTAGEAHFRYTYQPTKVTIDVTYPQSDWLRLRVDLSLNVDGYALTAQETLFNRLADGTTQESVTAAHRFSYNARGYLIEHQGERFTYPPGGATRIESTAEVLTYQDGNPVTIEMAQSVSGNAQPVRTTINHYGQQPNPLRTPFLLEFNPFGFSISRYLQPFLGQPAQRLLRASDNQQAGRPTTSTAYTYQHDSGGKLIRVDRAGVYPLTSSFDSSCP